MSAVHEKFCFFKENSKSQKIIEYPRVCNSNVSCVITCVFTNHTQHLLLPAGQGKTPAKLFDPTPARVEPSLKILARAPPGSIPVIFFDTLIWLGSTPPGAG